MSAAWPPPPAGWPGPQRRSNRPLAIGAVLGVVVPLLGFVPAFFDRGAALVGAGGFLWAATAFLGMLLLAFDRTRRYGLGILIGFCGLVVVGAGVCTVVAVGSGIGG